MEKSKETYKLPEGWEIVKIEDISVPSSKTNKNQSDITGDFYYIDVNSIDNKLFSIVNPQKYNWNTAPSRAQQIIRTNNILFATVRPYLRNIALVSEKYNQHVCSSAFCVIHPIIVNAKYVFYYVLSNQFIQSVNKLAKGTSYPAVTNRIVWNQTIPLAPLLEQHRIVSKIESLFSELDQAEKGLKIAQQQLEVYRQALLKNAFEGKMTINWRSNNTHYDANLELSNIKISRKNKYTELLNEGKVKNPKPDFNFKYKKDDVIPTWSIAKLDNLIGINARIGWRGLTKKEYTKEGALFLSVHALNYGKNVVFDEANHISIDRYNESPEIKLEIDDILLCKDGAGIGKVGIIKQLPDIATVNSSLLVIKAKEVFNPDFLYYFFYGPSMQRLVNEKISGSAIPHLFQKDIKEFNLKVPPIKEQDQIVKLLESRFTLIENLEKSIKKSLKDITLFKQSVLKKAFEGKLIAQDSTDEPANLLLQKIRIEKSKYLIAQKELDKLKPKKKRQMDEKKTVLEILKESKEPISTQELWTNSIHEGDIESFYKEIKEIFDQLDEIKESTESLLSLKK